MRSLIAGTVSAMMFVGLTQSAAAEGMGSGWYVYGMLNSTDSKPKYQYYENPSVAVKQDGTGGTIGVGKTLFTGEAGTLAVEADVSAGDYTSDSLSTDMPPCYGSESEGGGCTFETKWLATLRFVVSQDFGKLSPFFTAGLAAGRVNGFADYGACGYVGDCSYDETLFGGSLGVGANYAISDRLSLRGEVMYIMLNEPSFTASSVTGSDFNFTQARIGLSYRF